MGTAPFLLELGPVALGDSQMYPTIIVWDHDTNTNIAFWYANSRAEVETLLPDYRARYPEPRYEVRWEYIGGGTSPGAYAHASGYHN